MKLSKADDLSHRVGVSIVNIGTHYDVKYEVCMKTDKTGKNT